MKLNIYRHVKILMGNTSIIMISLYLAVYLQRCVCDEICITTLVMPATMYDVTFTVK